MDSNTTAIGQKVVSFIYIFISVTWCTLWISYGANWCESNLTQLSVLFPYIPASILKLIAMFTKYSKYGFYAVIHHSLIQTERFSKPIVIICEDRKSVV